MVVVLLKVRRRRIFKVILSLLACELRQITSNDFENGFSFRLVQIVGIVDLMRVQLCQLFKFYKSPLITEPLFCQIFAALIPHVFLRFASLFLLSILPQFL